MKFRYSIIALMYLTFSGCASFPTNNNTEVLPAELSATGAVCSVSSTDQAWIDQSVAAWHYTSQQLTNVGSVESLTAFFFDAGCGLTSFNAMAGVNGEDATFAASVFEGDVQLPDGANIPIGPTSFTKSTNGNAFFVMSLPSVWKSGGVDSGIFGLEKLMTAVLLHEASHVVQSSTYGQLVETLVETYKLPENFSDDSIQERFKSEADFAESVEKEMDLFFAAAAAPDDDSVRTYASQARNLMRKRRAKWFVGDDSYLSDAEDIWLSLEGSGQWAGYAYLVDAEGGAISQSDAMAGFALRGGWWTQGEGLGIALTLDRLGYDWKSKAFGGSSVTLTAMLDEALAGS